MSAITRERQLLIVPFLGALAVACGCGGGEPRAPGPAESTTLTDADADVRTSDAARDAGRVEGGTTPDAEASAVPLTGGRHAVREYPLHGVALFHIVNVYTEPNSRSERLGVLRRGARVRLGVALEGRGCREGRWHPIQPAGYVCSGRTMRVGESPPEIAFTPEPPRLDAPTPYDYGRNRREGAPLYRRVPTSAEIRAEREYQTLLAAEAAAAAAGAADGGAAATPDPESTEAAEASGGEEEEGDEGDEEDEEDERARTGPIVARLKRGFYVTMEATIAQDGRRWVRTSELNYVEASAIYKRQVPEIEGAALGEGLTLPIVITYRDTKSRRAGANGRIQVGREIESYTPLPLLGITRLGGEEYFSVGDNELVTAERARPIQPMDPPPEVADGGRWIDVDLTHQTLVAYEGARPVYATLVSTGKQGFETPTGTFRITSKYISTNMSDAPDGDEPYLIEDVPWTMYFNLAVALHGAFWHSRLGRERSHGCVNLAPADARWLFFWVGPELPEGWHGVTSTDDNPGTWVIVHR